MTVPDQTATTPPAETPAGADQVAADAAYYARLLHRLRDRLALISQGIADEGDRVYFGSTNDADDLRALAQDLDDVNWDRVTRGAVKRDFIAELRAANAARRALCRTLGQLAAAAQALREDMAKLCADPALLRIAAEQADLGMPIAGLDAEDVMSTQLRTALSAARSMSDAP